MSFMYFYVKNIGQNKWLSQHSGGDNDLYVVADKLKGRDYTQWRFDTAKPLSNERDRYSGSYYIVNRRFDKTIYAPSSAKDPARAYGTAKGSQQEWTLIPREEGGGKFKIYNKAKDRALIGGSNGRVYGWPFNSSPERKDLLWELELAEEGSEGPAFYVKDQKLVKIDFDVVNKTVLEEPPKICQQIVQNSSNTEQQQKVTLEDSWGTTSTVQMEHSIKFSLTVSMSAQFEVPEVCKSTIEMTTEFGEESKESNSFERQEQHSFAVEVPVTVPPNSGKRVVTRIHGNKLNVPFVATWEENRGSGESVIIEERGTWEGVQYYELTTEFSDIPLPTQ
jgi:hypothetical protein